jgi:predicted RND superfamily exporter protein
LKIATPEGGHGMSKKEDNLEKKEDGLMIKIATFVVDKRNLFFLLFAIAIIFSLFSSNWVEVENDLSAYLPDSAETSIGLELMDEEYITYGTANVMVANITYEAADELADKITGLDYVAMVQFDNSAGHYNDFSALFTVTFPFSEDDERCLESLDKLKDELSEYDIFVSTELGDQASDTIASEMQTITIYVAIIVLLVLLFTSDSYAEIPVLVLTFVVSALLSNGTNFALGTISFVSNSVAVVLQLALSVDYAVILLNKYKYELQTNDARSADIIALSKAIPEISASSLTTIGGLVAMSFMQYGIGPDLAIVLVKAILLSLLSVFLFMPGLILDFSGLMEKSKHKSFIPKISFVGKFAYRTRYVVPFLFIILIVVGYYYSSQCPYVYGYSTLTTAKQSEQDIIDELMDDTFGTTNMVAMNVPAGDYTKEAKLIQHLVGMDEVDSATGLANTEAMDGRMLTDKLNAREFAELLDVDSEVADLLYAAYAINDEDYSKLLGGITDYSVPFIDMFLFLHDEIENGYVTLESDQQEMVDDAYTQIMVAKNQLQGENYDRILFYLTLPEEGDETFAFLDEMHTIAASYYGEDAAIVIAGNATSQYDLKTTFERDNTVVNVVSMLAVLAVLLFTFKSAGMPVLLILVIEGCIWINFSYPTITHNNLFFMGYLIVSSIQMGANIDYAIVVSSRYQDVKRYMSPRDAIIDTMNYAFPTIVTSGTMLAMAGILIGQMTSEPCISGIGQCLGRGTIISIIAVLFALPQILLFGDKIIDKTSFDMNVSLPIQQKKESGLVYLDGAVQGHIDGEFVGIIHGTVVGNVDVRLRSGGEQNEKEAETKRLTRKEGNKEMTGKGGQADEK